MKRNAPSTCSPPTCFPVQLLLVEMANEFNHHDTEAQLKVDGREYADRRDANASAAEKYGMLDDMTQDTNE